MITSSTRMLDAALFYARNGLAVFPLHHKIADGVCSCNDPDCKSIGKHPRIKNGLTAATTDENIIQYWLKAFPNCNLGLVTGARSGIFAIDVDTKQDGLRAWETFKDDHMLDDYNTPVQRTQSGGTHIFYKMPEGKKVTTRTNVLAKGIDVRGDGGYVVIAPSVGYAFVTDQAIGEIDFEEADQAILDLVVKPEFEEKAEFKAPIEGLLNLDAGLIEKIESALDVLDYDEHDTWAHVGWALHDTNGKQAFQLWCDWSEQSGKYNHNRQVEFWEDSAERQNKRKEKITIDKLWKLANDTEKWHWEEDISDVDFSSFGKSAEQLQKNLQEAHDNLVMQAAKNINEPCIFSTPALIIHSRKTLKEYNEKYPTERFWDDGALFQGCTLMISGVPKVGKSKFLLDLCKQAAIGGEFLGKPFTRPLKTLWLQAEIKEEFLAERIEDAALTLDVKQAELFDENFLCSGKFSLDILQRFELAQIMEIVKVQGIDFLAIDPIVNISTVNENDNKEVVQMLKLVDQIKRSRCPQQRRELTAVAIVHHMKKSSTNDDPFDGIRGASAFRGYYDTGVALIANEDEAGVINAHFEYRNQESPPMQPFKFDENSTVIPYELKKPFDDGSDQVDNAERQLAEELHLLIPTQTGVYSFVRDHIIEHGKQRKTEVVNLMAKNRVQGIRVKQAISGLIDTVCKQSRDHGGEIELISHEGELWIQRVKRLSHA